MLISEFAKATGLTQDTIRFYIGKGLLKPRRSEKGGSNAYQIFNEDDVTAARMIRLQQSLGYTLREIAALNDEYRKGMRSPKRTAQIMRTQIGKLEEKQAQVENALAFLRDKLQWIEAGKPADTPRLNDYYC